MRLAHWLQDLFQEEAAGAGEAPGGTIATTTTTETAPDPAPSAAPSHSENLAFVEQWAAARSEDTPITTTATATIAEPSAKPLPVETTSTDAAAPSDAALVTGEETGLDPLLLQLAEAFDYQPDELAGFTNDGLKKLIARENRKNGVAAPAAEATKPTETAPAAPLPKTDVIATTTAPVTATFADYQRDLEEKLIEDGLGEDAIAREVRLAKVRWDREESMLTDARQARAEAEGMRQEMTRQQQAHQRELEVTSLLDLADRFADLGHAELFGTAQATWTPAQQAARRKLIETYDVLHTLNPTVPVATLGNKAFAIAFHDDIQKRESKSFAKRAIAQANQVLGSAVPAKTLASPPEADGKWNDPKIVRHFDKMTRNAT